MNISISKRMGLIVAVTLTVTLAVMFIILLSMEEAAKKNKSIESVSEISQTLTQSIIFSMGEGITDVEPFIERSKSIKNIRELRIIPTDKIAAGSEQLMDLEEKKVIQDHSSKFYEEIFNEEEVCRSIEAILADDNCITCHDANINDPLAVISLRYSMKEDYAAISSQRWIAIIMSLGTIAIAFFIVMVFLKKQVITDLLSSINNIKKLAVGDLDIPKEINRNDEIGVLSDSINNLQAALLNQSDAANNIAKGNLNISIPVLSEKDVLGKAMVTVKESLNSLVTDIQYISESAEKGELKKQVDSQKHQGVYREIIEGCNYTLQVVSLPIEAGSETLAKMAEGDFSVRMEGEYNGDFNKIKNSINIVADSLNEALNNVTQTVQETACASSQISASTEELAAGAHEQENQAMEVANSIRQVTQTIIDTTRNSTLASEASKKAGAVAREGGDVILETIKGMDRISQVVHKSAETVQKLGTSSQQIGEIIQVIDDIADQTNLLALNAAIEAARAGEQGRGFAVVADEVRKLSERTTKATQEIAMMIKKIQADTIGAVKAMEEGKKEVEKGKELADRSGSSLNIIIEGTEKVVELVSSVAAASEEESNAIEIISSNIEAINSVTQQNSSGNHQIAKAAEDLNVLIQNLEILVSRFKLTSVNKSHKTTLKRTSILA